MCNVEKPLSKFNFRKDTGRYRNYCLDCGIKKLKIWIKRNPVKVKHALKKAQRKYRKKFLNTNSHKVAHTLRVRINHALHGHVKHKKTFELLGCSIQKLISHLQKQFKRGMTWNNHSLKGWHIDHIKPCAKFDLSKMSEQRKCFHYTNLQPLWAKENSEKGTK